MKGRRMWWKLLLAGVCLVAGLGGLSFTDGAFWWTEAWAMAETGCRNCHTGGADGNLVDEHHLLINTKLLSCGNCHPTRWDTTTSSYVIDLISDCTVCHAQPPHHNNPDAQNGNCAHCHVIPDWAKDAPVQAACRQCHIGSDGFVKRKLTTSPNHSYNINGLIKDFGACFACHNPVPYHPKPLTPPKWWEISTDIAPGRGSFNLFYSQFKRRAGYYEDNNGPSPVRGYENLEEYGEEVIQNTQGSKWSKPAIAFNWAAISHAGVSYTVPTFDMPVPPPPTAPTITSLDRTSGSSGTTVQITGTNLGAIQGTSYVLFGTVKPTISYWTATQIRFRVPSLSRLTYQVKVVVNGVASNEKSFQIR